MAQLEFIHYIPHRPVGLGKTINWVPSKALQSIEGLPQIFWADGTPWDEANHWALERATCGDVKLKTAQDSMRHLHKYASWLEEVEMDWRHFPISKKDRVLNHWRMALIEARRDGRLAPSTTSARMNATIGFYRHAQNFAFVNKSSKWVDIPVNIRYFDTSGFERSLSRVTTDLSIPNRIRPGLRLEDGLLPITAAHRDELLNFSAENCSPELYLMLKIGFWTGARIQTITDIKIANLENAVPDSVIAGMAHVRCGPGSVPYVATKFDVSGDLLLPVDLLEELKTYAYSVRRSKRQLLSSAVNKGLLFLTRYGNSYAQRENGKSTAINVLMGSLRASAVAAGLKFMVDFKFHQTRATYGTWLLQICLEHSNARSALAFVQVAMFHKSPSTTMRYIKFLEQAKAKIEIANAFSKAFSGIDQCLRGGNK